MPPLVWAGLAALLAFNLFGSFFILSDPESAAGVLADRRQWFTGALYRMILAPSTTYDNAADLTPDTPRDVLVSACRRRARRSLTFALAGVGTLVGVLVLQTVRTPH